MNRIFFILILGFSLINIQHLQADDGYRLWLKYDMISNPQKLEYYKQSIKGFMGTGESQTMEIVKSEIKMGLEGLLGSCIQQMDNLEDGTVIAGTIKDSPLLASLNLEDRMQKISHEGYLILNTTLSEKEVIIIIGKEDIGVLYGTYHFLRLLQTHQEIKDLDITESPKIKLRLLNHWDNLDRTQSRGYAGFSIWDWHKLPDYIHNYYYDYARANASVGINGVVLNNVNASPYILTSLYIKKVAKLAEIFRPYGIKVYLAANFNAPKVVGGQDSYDPLDKKVQLWWKNKSEEIYDHIPDFGGFLVKANSEGYPGPQEYGRTHLDGANMMADALRPHNGILMWRAFVYDPSSVDRAREAYDEFKPYDGKFRDNVFVQVKNGPVDFQPREPFSPLFGAVPKTHLMMEFQITQEYFGFGTHLAYLGPMYKEVLNVDTYSRGKGSTVAKVIDGSLDNHTMSGIAGVANVGTDRNWTGHLFAQSNWYVFGRLAWDHQLTAEEIAEEWIRMTFSNEPGIIIPIKKMMMISRETIVKYMIPLGLHHIISWSHYGPAPWMKVYYEPPPRDYISDREDWSSYYYHKADSIGIGFNRTASGSNAVNQYFPPVRDRFMSLTSCPDEYLLWFHHVEWDYRMRSGNTLWEEICYHYYAGVDSVREIQARWEGLKGKVDDEHFDHVQQMLRIQEREAVWWRNACVLYFQSVSKRPIPAGLEKPNKSLEYYKSLDFPYAPE